MRHSVLMAAVRQFLKTTTLHGFKYLSSPHCGDRIGWLACCFASACCAGVLCAVLWVRFQQVPALLILRDLREGGTIQTMPAVAICPPGDAIATSILSKLEIQNSKSMLHSILTRVIDYKPEVVGQLSLLEELFSNHSAKLPDMLLDSAPPCEDMVKLCRWEQQMEPCENLFQYEMTSWGACCVMKTKRLTPLSLKWDPELQVSKEMDLIIECRYTNSSGCMFFTKYVGQESVKLTELLPGLQYFAQVMFTAEVDGDKENEGGRCVAATEYSASRCMIECVEKACGCSDPLLNISYRGRNLIPHCSITKLTCIRNTKPVNKTCNCLPRCKKVFDASSLEASPMAGAYTIDPLLMGINTNTTTALYIRVRNGESRFYNSIPTENWITLLASLGGVFNMFLGVGLFSALEVLYLIFIRIPIAISAPTELHVTPVIH